MKMMKIPIDHAITTDAMNMIAQHIINNAGINDEFLLLSK